jgi:hypothetical protein
MNLRQLRCGQRPFARADHVLEQQSTQMKPETGLLARFTATHPELRDRLIALADLGVPSMRPSC